jgi:glucan phosphoethanolaminetransferase (alkaline phosphatase superfamily)
LRVRVFDPRDRVVHVKPDASIAVSVGIPLLAVIVLSVIAFGVHRCAPEQPRRVLAFVVGASAWLGFTGVLAQVGFFADFDVRPPRLLVVLLPVLVGPVWLARSALGTRLMKEISIAALVGFHAFRLPLELVMHQAAVETTMPEQMTYTGWNFDIVTGVTAIIVALLAANNRAPRWLLVTWNALGSLLLLVVVVIALASLPLFHLFGNEAAQLNTWVAYFPFVWLPAVLVSSALFGHAVLWKRLVA